MYNIAIIMYIIFVKNIMKYYYRYIIILNNVYKT